MDVPLEMLMHPERLTNEQLLFIIQERRIRIPNLQTMPRDDLLEVFHNHCVPSGQRNYSYSGRGRKLNRSPTEGSDSNSYFNITDVDSQPNKKPWSESPWNQSHFEPPETNNEDGHPKVLENTMGIPPVQDELENSNREEEDLLKSTSSKQTGPRTGSFFKYKTNADRKKARQERRKFAKALVRGRVAKGTSDNTQTRMPKKLMHQETPSKKSSEPPLAKRQNCYQGDDGARSSAKRSSELAVAFGRGDGALVDEALGAVIRDRILANMERAIEHDEDDRKLAFATSGLVSEGFFLVTPETEEARDWLLSCDLGEFQGISIVARRVYRARVMVWLPGRDKMPMDIIKWLQRQNKGRIELMPNEWTFITKEVLPTGVRLVMGIPPEAAEAWGATQMLHFQLTKVVAKLLCGTSRTSASKICADAPGQLGSGALPNYGCADGALKIGQGGQSSEYTFPNQERCGEWTS